MALIAHATSAEASYLCICFILFSTLLYAMQIILFVLKLLYVYIYIDIR